MKSSHIAHVIIRVSKSTTAERILKLANALAMIVLLLIISQTTQAQSCDNSPQGGGESISGKITIDGSTTQLTNNAVVPIGTLLRLDSVATADGRCVGMAWYCSPCVCQETGYIYERTVSKTNVTVDASSAGGLNGNYVVGTVFGRPFAGDCQS